MQAYAVSGWVEGDGERVGEKAGMKRTMGREAFESRVRCYKRYAVQKVGCSG